MYLLSNLLSLVASIICAFSQNIGMLIVFRALQSCGANAGLTLGIYSINEKGSMKNFQMLFTTQKELTIL